MSGKTKQEPEGLNGAAPAGEKKKKRSAAEAAMQKLAARMRTEQELRNFLEQAQYGEAETEAAIKEMKSYGYLNDERYCGEYFRYAKAKGKADGRIVRELVQKGIDAETARNIVEDLRAEAAAESGEIQDDRSAALTIGRKMLRGQWEEGKKADDRFLARVGRRLAGLGYESSVIYDVLGKLRQDERDREKSENDTIWE